MSNLAWTFVSTLLVNNFTLVMFLGLCSFFGVTAKIETAWRLGLANTFVLLLTGVMIALYGGFATPRKPQALAQFKKSGLTPTALFGFKANHRYPSRTSPVST